MDRRDEIYEEALRLFIENGYDNTPLSHIARSLNLTKAGLYHYFSSKEELLFRINTFGVERHFLPVLETAEKIEDPEERIAFFIKNYTVKNLTQSPAIKIAIHEVQRLKPTYQRKIRKTWRRAFDLIRDAISELETAGRIKKVNKTFATFALLGMCTWTLYWFDYERRESAEELADTYVEIFMRGLLKAR